MNEMAYPYIENEIEATPAIPLAEIKSYLKLSENNNFIDAELTLMCSTALSYAEKYSRRYFTPKTVTTNRCFWGEFRNGIFNSVFTLRRSPLQEVVSIKFDDENVLEKENYKVMKNQNGYSEIILNGNLPELKNDWFPIEITFIAGYKELPNDIKLAMLQHIASMWMNRGDCDDDKYNKCPKISKDIYKKYKIIEIGA